VAAAALVVAPSDASVIPAVSDAKVVLVQPASVSSPVPAASPEAPPTESIPKPHPEQKPIADQVSDLDSADHDPTDDLALDATRTADTTTPVPVSAPLSGEGDDWESVASDRPSQEQSPTAAVAVVMDEVVDKVVEGGVAVPVPSDAAPAARVRSERAERS
jgi:hypothetical protein